MPASNATRDAEALACRAQGWNYDRIATEMGYANRSGAYKAVERAIAASVRETTDAAKILLIADLNEAKREAWAVLRRSHPVISNGRLFEDIEDDGPVLAAIDRITRIDQEMAKILGAYAPVKSEVVTLDAVEAEIRKLEAELGRNAGRSEAGAPEASA
jgi:hypothetical protein